VTANADLVLSFDVLNKDPHRITEECMMVSKFKAAVSSS
jgi:hypothetical protein